MSLFGANQDPFLITAPVRIGNEVIRRDNLAESIGFAVIGTHVRLSSGRTFVRLVLANVLPTTFYAKTFAEIHGTNTGLRLQSYEGGYTEVSHAFLVAGEIGRAQLVDIYRQGHPPDGVPEKIDMGLPRCDLTTASGTPCPVNAFIGLDDPRREIGVWRISPLTALV